MSYYARNPHYAPDDDGSEDAARLERCEEEAGSYFANATKPQSARLRERMADAAPYRGAPKWDRLRDAAKAEFKATTTAAAALYDETLQELLTTGEVSEAMSYRWDECAVASAMMEAA